ncbi:1-acyl-sn-glycerol-3-phosphate acyltransferase [Desulfobacteraceae bacterium SEEP-SAG9]|nr:1-acyl-sn-glycerol-3-phosphate acyltransferase [Desulfobacteraceae bacterium SEEP-SAG9]
MKIIFYWVLYPLMRPFYLIFLILNTLVLGTIVILISPLDRKGNFVHYIGKFWSLMNIFLSGTRIKITGKEKIQKNQPHIVISNHQSLFDVWALIGKIPLQIRWIVKLEIRKMPIFGYALERMGHIYVNRKNRNAAAASLEKAARKIKGGTSVIIFPEGTRSKNGHLLRFRRGGGIIALQSGVPILPVTINGSRFVLPKDTLDLMPGKIEVIVGDIIDPGQFDENRIDDLMDTVKSTIEKNLDLDYGKFA